MKRFVVLLLALAQGWALCSLLRTRPASAADGSNLPRLALLVDLSDDDHREAPLDWDADLLPRLDLPSWLHSPVPMPMFARRGRASGRRPPGPASQMLLSRLDLPPPRFAI